MRAFIQEQYEYLRRDLKQHIMVLGILVTLTYYGCWAVFQYRLSLDSGLIDYYLTSWESAPNRYRMYKQFLLFLHDNPFPLFTWLSLFWIICVYLTYLIIKPDSKDLLPFLVSITVLTLVRGVVDAPIYPILALLTVYRDKRWISLLLIPLALVKEIAAWVGLGVLFLYGENKREGIVSFSIGAAIYAILRFVVIGDVGYPPNAAPFFVLPVLPSIILLSLKFVVIQSALSLFILIVTIQREDLRVLLWTAVPVFLFASFWYSHLWFPVIMVALARRRTIPIMQETTLI